MNRSQIPGDDVFFQALRRELEGEVLSDELGRGIYATDASVYQIMPLGVALPKNEADVLAALRLARQYQTAILPRGGGTSLAGQTVGKSLVLDFSKYMNQVLEFNPHERWVRVQPGMVCDELNAFLAPHGLHFAPDPATSSRANVGGMIGNNSSGTKSIIYGKTIDHVLALKVALADGTILELRETSPESYARIAEKPDREGEIYRGFRDIIFANSEAISERFPKVMRRVGGYNLDEFIDTSHWNLARLVCGSEGTLAVILEATLRLELLPAHRAVCVAHFADLLEAIHAVAPMLDFQPAAVEILDRIVLDLSRQNLTTQRHCAFLQGHPAAIQIVEFYGDSAEEVVRRAQAMAEHLRQLGMGYAYPVFCGDQSYQDVWIVRKKGLGLMLGMKGDRKPLPFIEDAAIPIVSLPEYIDRVLGICRRHDTEVAMYAHASVGVIHVRPILDLRRRLDIERFQAIAEETFELVLEYGGAWSGEHGDGLVRSPFNERFFGPQVYAALKAVKKLFDPEWRMNPGKIVEAPPMVENLRYGVDYRDQILATFFHYRDDGGFAQAVHMCTGVGECRKLSGGVMCPSFRATRDEAHSTRGRANALRLAMSGQLGGEGLDGQPLFEVLDLCLSCKACKSECPSNVDMARLKSEVWQMRYDRHGPAPRDRLIRDSARAAAIFSGPLAPLINRIQRSGFFREALEKTVGFSATRILPEYARQPFHRWYQRHYSSNGGGKKVALFADTYLNYHEPGIGISATKLLQSLGYEVALAHVGCCQRAKISHGFLRQAKKDGELTARKLLPFLQAGLTVLVCEPSCASALCDDLPDLLDDQELGRALSAGVRPIEVFLAQELAAGRLTAPNAEAAAPATPLWVHGHCHQKALFGTAPMLTLLGVLGGYQVREIASGCCGMAGSFGYEKEHYALSAKIGEEGLFPTLRDSVPADAPVVACGFSCRHQIAHFTGKKAVHWVEAIADERSYKEKVSPNLGETTSLKPSANR
jgi:FAD/FMN-containing dehydrogenase/Fe-S oxidoreductase